MDQIFSLGVFFINKGLKKRPLLKCIGLWECKMLHNWGQLDPEHGIRHVSAHVDVVLILYHCKDPRLHLRLGINFHSTYAYMRADLSLPDRLCPTPEQQMSRFWPQDPWYAWTQSSFHLSSISVVLDSFTRSRSCWGPPNEAHIEGAALSSPDFN